MSKTTRQSTGALRIPRALIAVLLCLAASIATAESASELFDASKGRVFQIRVIDVASGDKYSIGSGFLISEEGHVATNFHVVSSFVHEPDKYRLEAVFHDGAIEPLSLLDIDVVHDLAIVFTGAGEKLGEPLALAGTELAKGERIFSMGNPHDLGMTIIEGTFNGLVENSRYRKILFSGSLNPGMSGGPALNAEGEVIGINVSKGGEQISFLVPVIHLKGFHLKLLYQEYLALPVPRDLVAKINSALLADQQQFYTSILAAKPEEKAVGDLQIPEKLLPSLKCWGHTQDDEEDKYQAVHQHCRSEDQIYVSQQLYVGDFYYDVEFITTEELNRFQFYHVIESRLSHRGFYNTNSEEEVAEYACHDDLMEAYEHTWKVSTCLRNYKKQEGLYDGVMAMASLDYPDRAAVITVGASGVSLENALAVFKYIAEVVRWKH